MAGLLSGGPLAGLLSPELKKAIMMGIASGGDPRNTAWMVESQRENAEALRQEEVRKLQEEMLRKQLAEYQKGQDKEAITRAMIQSATAQGLDKMQTPETQGLLRGHIAAYGDPTMAEQAGLLAPQTAPITPPKEAMLFALARDNPEFAKFLQDQKASGGLLQPPANVQEWQFFSGLTPEEQTKFMEMKRGGYDPTAIAAAAAAKAAGKESGTAAGQAQVNLPKIEEASLYMDGLLESLKGHPGMPYAVGLSSVAPIIPGTPAADFKARLAQVQGRQFLQAYETLKGGGQITEIEGAKAEAAIARMDRAQSEEEFLVAVDEFQQVVRGATARAKSAAGAQATPAPVLKFNPATGEFE